MGQTINKELVCRYIVAVVWGITACVFTNYISIYLLCTLLGFPLRDFPFWILNVSCAISYLIGGYVVVYNTPSRNLIVAFVILLCPIFFIPGDWIRAHIVPWWLMAPWVTRLYALGGLTVGGLLARVAPCKASIVKQDIARNGIVSYPQWYNISLVLAILIGSVILARILVVYWNIYQVIGIPSSSYLVFATGVFIAAIMALIGTYDARSRGVQPQWALLQVNSMVLFSYAWWYFFLIA